MTTSDKVPATSRYSTVELGQLALDDDRTVPYFRRRFIPPQESFALLRGHQVRAGERLDHIAATYLGDPEQYWRVADGNGAMAPEALTETAGRRLRITLPAGVPGTPGLEEG